jgi:deoxyribodipyrimidine photolyase-like uncharacterized protein
MNFRVGQRVVCVDAKPRFYSTCHLIEGAIYTIVGFREFSPRWRAAWVAEVQSQSKNGFFADRFRPVVERKTDTGMAILTKILDDVRERAPA